MWHELLIAIALVMVIEGLFPALNPGGFRRYLASMLQLSDSMLRKIGIGSMLAGAMMLYLIKG